MPSQEPKIFTAHDVMALQEQIRSEVKILGEGIEGIKEGTNKIGEKVEGIEKDITIIKIDIEFIKNGLKKKVDLEEFEALERRVLILENKLKPA